MAGLIQLDANNIYGQTRIVAIAKGIKKYYEKGGNQIPSLYDSFGMDACTRDTSFQTIGQVCREDQIDRIRICIFITRQRV